MGDADSEFNRKDLEEALMDGNPMPPQLRDRYFQSQDGQERFVTVLEIPTVESTVTTVRASIMLSITHKYL